MRVNYSIEVHVHVGPDADGAFDYVSFRLIAVKTIDFCPPVGLRMHFFDLSCADGDAVYSTGATCAQSVSYNTNGEDAVDPPDEDGTDDDLVDFIEDDWLDIELATTCFHVPDDRVLGLFVSQLSGSSWQLVEVECTPTSLGQMPSVQKWGEEDKENHTIRLVTTFQQVKDHAKQLHMKPAIVPKKRRKPPES